jgi:hypothetical protein
MPPKKEKPSTRDAATDPPEPLQYDPFDLDGRALINDWLPIPARLQEATDQLRKQNTTGAPKVIKDNVLRELGTILQWMQDFAQSLEKARTVSHRFQCIEREILEVKTETKNLSTTLQQLNQQSRKDLKETKATIKPAKSWTEIAKAQSSPEQVHVKQNTDAPKRQEQEKLRQACAKLAIVLTTTSASKEIRNQIASMHEKEITKRCQQAITESTLNTKPKLQGVSKLTNGIRIHCNSEEEVKQFKNIDWNHAFEGITVHKPKYGIVIHRVPMSDINFSTPRSEIIQQLEANNPDTNIIDVAPLLRKPNAESTSNSAVIHTDNNETANQWITHGFYANYCRYIAKRYTPQLQLTQCYNCHKYGHRAKDCKDEAKCGKCGKTDHATKECDSTTHKCSQCNGEHEAWHHHCPARITEMQRLKTLRRQTSPIYGTAGIDEFKVKDTSIHTKKTKFDFD